MKNNKNMYKPLDEYEKDLQETIDKVDSFKRPKNYKKVLAKALIAANNTSSKSKTLNIRIAEKDLIMLKTKAEKVGMPYHTLINTVLHQYAKGELKVDI